MSNEGTATPLRHSKYAASKFQDPLTPSSRRALEISSSSMSQSEKESPLSPRQALIQVLKGNTNVVTPSSQPSTTQLKSASYARLESLRQSSSYRASPRSTTDTVATDSKDLDIDPRILTFGTKIRLRFGAGKYVSIRTSNTPLDHRSVATEVRADGSGLDGDDDQIFVIQNCTMRKDRRPVRFSDNVSFHCIGRQSLYLSAHETTARVVARRGPIITPQETWSIRKIQDDDDMQSQQDNFMRTGDRIILTSRGSSRMACHEERFGEISSSVKLLIAGEANSLDQDIIEISNATVPYTPYWNKSRAFLNWSYLWTLPQPVCENSLDHVPSSLQEQIVIEDMLYVMLGIPGSHIRIDINSDPLDALSLKQVSFVVDQQFVDTSLSILVQKMLPMCEKYVQISQFIEEKMSFEYGQIVHAFSAAIKDLLKEYVVVVAQLEHRARQGELSLQKLWFYIQPSMRTIDLLFQVVVACNTSYGGALLTTIHATSASVGDGIARDTLMHLLHRASVPYFRMLELWLYFGVVDDPYAEFMVKNDDKLLKEDLQTDPWCKYWEKRYTLRDLQVPIFLLRLTDKILTTGKYLNIVRSCHREVKCPFRRTIEYTHGEREYEEIVNQAHEFASRIVLRLVMDEHKLLQRLSSLKHYFLMDQGDFFVEFMDIAEQELNERAMNVASSRLESLLHLALQTSSCAMDPYKDDLTCILSATDLISQMETIYQRSTKNTEAPVTISRNCLRSPTYKAVDAFTLAYHVEWPLSLIISASALNKYQMIFRHLFLCKHVERRLCDAWLHHQVSKDLKLGDALRSSYSLRQKMLHFQQNLGYFMIFEVVSPRWHDLAAKVRSASTVDEILAYHQDFLDNCLKECLLTDPDLLRLLTELMVTCTQFADLVEKTTKPYLVKIIEAEERMGNLGGGNPNTLRRRRPSTAEARTARKVAMSADFLENLRRVDDSGGNPFAKRTADLAIRFDALLAEFMQKLLHQSHRQFNSYLSNLCTRLDYNEFYTKE